MDSLSLFIVQIKYALSEKFVIKKSMQKMSKFHEKANMAEGGNDYQVIKGGRGAVQKSEKYELQKFNHFSP